MVNVMIRTYRNSPVLCDKKPRIASMSRVPVKGEGIWYDGMTVYVSTVTHYIEPQTDGVVAVIMVVVELD